MDRRTFNIGLGGVLFAATAPRAFAQEAFPAKTVRIIVPFPAGQATDILARMMADQLTRALGQQVIAENRPGAGGQIGADVAAKATPDGYTLLMVTISTHGISPALYPKLPYDPQKDLIPISNMATLSFVLLVNSDLPVKSVQDLVATAKARPGKMNYASGSTVVHLAGELFKYATGTDIQAIPYRGTAPQVTALLAKEVDLTFDPFLGIQHVRSGRLRALAVTAPKRSSLLPDVPTMQEAGLKDYAVETWVGVFAPAKTPRPIVDLLQREMIRIAGLPEVRERLASLSYDPVGSTSEQFAAQIVADTARWAKTVKDTNFKVNK